MLYSENINAEIEKVLEVIKNPLYIFNFNEENLILRNLETKVEGEQKVYKIFSIIK
jgi:hypothetical protein